MKTIAGIGSGRWGVALSIHLAKLGNKVKLWSFAEDERDLINGEHKCKFLPNVDLPDGIECSNLYEEVIKDSDFIVHVTPSKFTRNIVKEYKQYVTNQPIIICSIFTNCSFVRGYSAYDMHCAFVRAGATISNV